MNEFSKLQHQCGLSNQGAARLLEVRVDTVKNWRYGRTKVPDNVLLQMKQYVRAARMIFGIEAVNRSD